MGFGLIAPILSDTVLPAKAVSYTLLSPASSSEVVHGVGQIALIYGFGLIAPIDFGLIAPIWG